MVVMMRRIYLDNNATTPVLPEALEAMRPYFGETFGNASSIHHHGQETRAAVERSRDSVASLLGCRPAEIVFTSGGTEGDNLAIMIEISFVLGLKARRTSSGSTRPRPSTGKNVTAQPVSSRCLHACKTA
jgi:cysteine sulfinate desulfinase/cysteine desulfurase-like protein